jgi:hypothetical protein
MVIRLLVARGLTRVGLGLSALGLVACCAYPFGVTIRGMGNIDEVNPLFGIGIRVAFFVIGGVMVLVGMFLEPSAEGAADDNTEVGAPRGPSVWDARAAAADPRIAQFLHELSQQARLSVDPTPEPDVYQVVRILWTDQRGSHFRGLTMALHEAGDPDVTGATLCLERKSAPATHVLASKVFSTGQSHVQPTDPQSWSSLARAGLG